MSKVRAGLTTVSRIVALASIPLPTSAEELVPNDQSIAPSLAVWLQDISTSFDPGTGIWADSSGKGRNAIPVGEVNIAELRTFLPPTLSTVSGDGITDDELASVKFGGDINDLLVVEELNGGTALTDLTLVVVYNVDLLAAIPSQIRPIGIGSVSAQQANPGDHFNLASDPSIRKDNGQIGANTYDLPFPNQTTLIRIARMSSDPNTIEEWLNVDGTLQKVLSVNGVSFTTSSDDFFLGDLRAGASGTPGVNGVNPAIADFDIVQTIAYTSALTDQQIADLNEWVFNNPGGTGGSVGARELAFTRIAVAEDRTSATLAWQSKPGVTYAVDLTYDLESEIWIELNDDINSGGEETTMSLPTFTGEQPARLPERAFYRVREIPSN